MTDTASPTPSTRNAGEIPAQVALQAPVSGRLLAIEQVPDPVFAQKMVGDGVAIDPVTELLVAPCDGEVLQLHSAGHAVTIGTPEGLEVLMHIGLDTVELRGEGFTPRVQVGDRVATGDPLVEFDADYVATHAKSLLTEVVITNPDRVEKFAPRSGDVTAGQDVILELTLAGVTEEAAGAPSRPVTSEAVLVPNPTGLHARPSAVLANVAKKYRSDVKLVRGDDRANAKSVVSIMGLEVRQGDKVQLVAQGPDAEAAIAALTPMLEQGLGDEGAAPAPAPASMTISESAAPAPRERSLDPNLLLGVSASPGLAVGYVFQIRHEEIEVAEEGEDPHRERRKLDQAIDQAKVQLETLEARLHGEADPGKAAIFAAHEELLDDPDLLDIATSAIAKGKSAAFAWQRAYTTYADRLSQLKNELIAQRANDLRDVGQRVLELLTGMKSEKPDFPPSTVIVAEDLTPSDTATLDRSKVVGICTTAGGASSHVAILARSLDIPLVAGIDPRALDLPNGSAVILDGSKGTLRLNATEQEVERIRARQQRLEARRRADLERAMEPANTLDGHHIEVVANIGGPDEAEETIRLGGEGVGLLRSEFLFMERFSAPTEQEQTETYRRIAETLGPDRPLVVRTLDVGGDKPLSYLPIPREENPFLGVRGVRVGLNRPELLRTQLRAILRAATVGRLHIMFPMIATLPEWRAARGMLEEERAHLGLPPVPVGIMVEIPSAALMADQFAAEADFFSIGTNDLTQYTLAMDRGHPELAPQVDGLNPAVLQLIAMTVRAAHKHGRWVGVCGGIAGDPQAIPLLVGLGVDELSVSVPTLPSVKAQIRTLSKLDCEQLAQKALEQDTAAAVRALSPDLFDDDEDATAREGR